jgi:hypothetical protein
MIICTGRKIQTITTHFRKITIMLTHTKVVMDFQKDKKKLVSWKKVLLLQDQLLTAINRIFNGLDSKSPSM